MNDFEAAIAADTAAEQRGWWPILECEEEPWTPSRNVDCPDCGGVGIGCCVNADIPLPGVER